MDGSDGGDVRVVLSDGPDAPRQARRYLVERLRGWPDDVVDRVVLAAMVLAWLAYGARVVAIARGQR